MGGTSSKHEGCEESRKIKKALKKLKEDVQRSTNANQERMETCITTITKMVRDNDKKRLEAEGKIEREQEEAKKHRDQMELMIVQNSQNLGLMQQQQSADSAENRIDRAHTEKMIRALAQSQSFLLDRVAPSENIDVDRAVVTPQHIRMNWVQLSD